MIRCMPPFSVVGENGGWRHASQLQKRPQPRKITVSDVIITKTSNTLADLQDSADNKRRKFQGSSAERIAALPGPKQTRAVIRPTPTRDAMTLDELDKVTQEEESKFTEIMRADLQRSGDTPGKAPGDTRNNDGTLKVPLNEV
jgi:hypothetical protein